MKKALVVLLLLAVAGGLFAQVTFTGGVFSGLGLSKAGDADATVGLNSAWNDSDGIRAQINATYANEEGTYGFFGRLRASASALGGIADNTGFAGGLELNQLYGWMTGFNGLAKARGGRMVNTETMAVDYNWADTLYGNNAGIQGYVYPIPGLTVGVGVKSNVGAVSGAALMEALNYWGGVKYVADVFAFAAEFDYLKDSNTRLGVSVDFTGVDILDIDAAVRIAHLENEDAAPRTMRFDEHVGLNLIENVGIHIVAREEMSAADNADMLLGVGASLDYTGLGKITPAIDIGYVQGAAFHALGLAGRQWGDATWSSDNSFISVSPSAKFSATDKAYLRLGYTLGMDLGDAPTAGNNADNKMNHALYLDFVVEF